MSGNADIEAVLLDFKSEYEADPDRALGDLVALLIDPSANAARLALLQAMAADRSRLSHIPVRHRVSLERLQQLVDIVSTDGPVSALEAGAASVDELDAITWNADALRQLHERLMAEPDPQPNEIETTFDVGPVAAAAMAPGSAQLNEIETTFDVGPVAAAAMAPGSAQLNEIETTFDDGTACDLTRFWRQGNKEQLRSRLDACMPALLEYLGADKSLAEQAVDHILARPYDPQVGSFRAAVSKWLVEFVPSVAHRSAIGDAGWRRVLVRAAVESVLRPYREPAAKEQHPGWVAEFCRNAPLGQLHVVEDLLEWELPSGSQFIEQLTAFRYSLYERACQTERELLAAWQLSS